jgi:hypothetical protein
MWVEALIGNRKWLLVHEPMADVEGSKPTEFFPVARTRWETITILNPCL